MDSQTKICQNCHNSFVIDAQDFEFYEKIKVPSPTFCPECRLIRRMMFRNERNLYKRICDLCGKSIITPYHPKYPSPVYCNKCYYSDKWDPCSHSIIYDSKRPFFEQLGKLILRVPKVAIHTGTGGSQNVNSEYINFAGGAKNCYLIFNATKNEDCAYSRGIIKCRDTFDAYFADQIESCYEVINVNKSNKIIYGQNIFNSLGSYFVLNCNNVQNCFGCVNLRNKSYYFFNEPLSKNDWIKKTSEILGSYKKMKMEQKRFEEFSLKFIRKENNSMKSIDCIGDYAFESKNCFSCFEISACENCKYCFAIKHAKDSCDIIGRGINSELLLECVAVGHGCSKIIGSWSIETSYDIEYSYDIRTSDNCFGCVGLNHAKNCILNKQYSETEYQKIRKQIIFELKNKNLYGLYLPIELSPWAYNETIAQEYFPLTKEQAIEKGYSWKESEERNIIPDIKTNEIPDHIKDVKDDILNKIIQCQHSKLNPDGSLMADCNEQCTTAFKIIKPELEFYRKMNLALPRLCPNCRHYQRIKQKNPLKLWHRKCQCNGDKSSNGIYKNTIEHFHGNQPCPNEFETTYSPDRPEIIYCEKCYLAEVA
ncbi:MAG: hypothetical protein ABH808_04190 [Candidatus Kuenenbacteria bacterium]